MKLRLRNRDILLPVAEAEFGFDISRLTKHYANEPGLRIRFEKNFTERVVSVGGIAGALAWHTPLDGISYLQRSSWSFTGGRSGIGDVDGAAES